MTTLSDIEILTADYAKHHRAIYRALEKLQRDVEAIQEKANPSLRRHVEKAITAKAALTDAINSAPELFNAPRTRIFHGVKIGLNKGKDTTSISDEAETIRRIRNQLPKDQAEQLISVKESVFKPGLASYQLSDLRRLGITYHKGNDAVVIKVMDDAIEKAVASLLNQVKKGVA